MNDLTLYNYLNSLRSETGKEFSESVLNIAYDVWQKLKSYFQENNLSLEVPDVCVGYQDNIMFTWLKGEHYLAVRRKKPHAAFLD